MSPRYGDSLTPHWLADIRAAYKRGREDAARDAEQVLGARSDELMEVVFKHADENDTVSLDFVWIQGFSRDLFIAVSAARGGEQE